MYPLPRTVRITCGPWGSSPSCSWNVSIDNLAGTITWSTDDFGTDPDANALRWGQLFSFWFDADTSDAAALFTLGTFKDGGTLIVPFTPVGIFTDGFESGDTSSWSQTNP